MTARESPGRQIARWAPRAGRSAEERERFAVAVDRWLAVTGTRPHKAAGLARGREAIEHVGSTMILGKAHSPWDAADFEREAELATLDVDHKTGCPRPRPRLRQLGRRVDGRQGSVLECGHCGAALPIVDGRLEATAVMASEPPPPGRPGRPRWEPERFHDHYREALRATTAPRTPGRIAENFRRLDGAVGVEPGTLARLLRRHGRPKLDLE